MELYFGVWVKSFVERRLPEFTLDLLKMSPSAGTWVFSVLLLLVLLTTKIENNMHSYKLVLPRPELEPLFKKDRDVLMGYLKELPKQCGMRKVNEIVKRITLNMTHVCFLGCLREKMPSLWVERPLENASLVISSKFLTRFRKHLTSKRTLSLTCVNFRRSFR